MVASQADLEEVRGELLELIAKQVEIAGVVLVDLDAMADQVRTITADLRRLEARLDRARLT